MARVGLFGGTFNPIHIGHLTIAEEARTAAALDEVTFIPSGESYLKDPLEIAPREDRYAMTKLACAGRFTVSDIETRREGPSYTADTCRELRQARPEDELFLILGADNLMQIERWHAPQAIFDSATLLAFTRGGQDADAFRRQADHLRARYGARIQIIDVFSLDVSSSQIRRWIAQGHAVRYLVTEPVYQYIRERELYGCNSQKPSP